MSEEAAPPIPDLLCRLWGVEELPDTTQHWCHAKQFGFAGGVHQKSRIEEDLEHTLSPNARWVLRACQPLHDGSACETCEYNHVRGLVKYYEYFC